VQASGVRIRMFNLDRFSAEEIKEWRFIVDGASELTVNSAAGDVDVIAGEGDEVLVTAHKTAWSTSNDAAQAALADMALDVTQNGNAIDVRFTQETDVLIIGETHLDTVDFTIVVPSGTAVTAATNPGDITLGGLEGAADLRTGFGDVSIQEASGALAARTDSGTITVRRVDAGSAAIDLATQFGDLILENVRAGEIAVRTSSGDLTLHRVTSNGDVSLDSEFGDIRFEVGKADGLTVESNSAAIEIADVSMDGALIIQNGFGDITLTGVSARSYDLVSNSGLISIQDAQGMLRVKSEFGGIKVGSAQDANLDLQTNSGDIEFAGSLGDGPHTLEAEFGDIHLSLPDDAALTVDLETEFGRLSTGFALTLSGEMDANHWRGTINGGGALLSASANSGDILIESLEH
jgi:DUF4097 and DUF4098 domain-containing protein YvlB